MNKIKNIDINKLFIIIASILGITFSILFPLYQTPDELTHIDMIYEERNIKASFLEINEGYSGTENIMNNENQKVNLKEYFDFTKKINLKTSFVLPKITIIRHFPQWIGMIIGEQLHLPIFFYFTLCELMALTFYIIICNKALKKMPEKKELMMLIMLLPVCCQQMSSFSYDVMLNSCSFLFIATIFELKSNNRYLRTMDFFKLIGLLIIIGICKIPYVFLGFLCLILFDTSQIKLLKKRQKIILVLTTIILIVIFMIIGYHILIKYNIGRLLISSLINPINTIKLYYRTLAHFIIGYFESIVGNLGWFDVKVSRVFVVLVYLFMIILTIFDLNNKNNQQNKLIIKNKDKIIILITALALVYLIILSMFNWTLFLEGITNYNNLSLSEYARYLKTMKAIVGVQGRYFIPIIPLILIPVKRKKNKNLKINLNIIMIIYFIIMCIYYIYILLNRYWI